MNSPNHDKPAFFDAYSDRYDEAVNKAIAFSGLEVDFFVRVKAAYMQDILADYFEDTSQVDLLDVGCGVGNYHKYWINNVRSLHGVDVSAMSIARASERNPSVRYKVYDGDKLPFADKTFDAAVAICVMHHVTPIKRPSFATELRRVMKRGGLAVIFEHNPSNLLTRRVVSSCVFDEGVTLLTHKETEYLMKQAGFENQRSHFILTIPAATKFLRHIDRLFSRFSLGAQYFTCATIKKEST